MFCLHQRYQIATASCSSGAESLVVASQGQSNILLPPRTRKQKNKEGRSLNKSNTREVLPEECEQDEQELGGLKGIIKICISPQVQDLHSLIDPAYHSPFTIYLNHLSQSRQHFNSTLLYKASPPPTFHRATLSLTYP